MMTLPSWPLKLWRQLNMIKNIKARLAEGVYSGRCPKELMGCRAVAERKMQFLDSANAIGDLRSPPGNRLEKLAGNRTGQYSIRINDQYRICFRWTDGEAQDVEIVDYH